MIYLSIVVPSYNAEKYLPRCIPSLVIGGEDVEIIIVNDGSKDNTLKVAQDYAKQYKNIKIIDKENGGHGSGINAALSVAKGLYFKCVDADDWLDEKSYKTLLSTIKNNYKKNIVPDLYLTNFVYNRYDEGVTKVRDYSGEYPENRLLTWKDIKRPTNRNYFMMHMFVYKLDVLTQSQLVLPEHTFYVDNLYVYQPLYYVKTMWYLNIPLYQYYVGHSGQSISFENMAKNYMHEMRVYEKIMFTYTYDDIQKLDKWHQRHMIFCLVVNASLAAFYEVLDKKSGSHKVYRNINKKVKKENNGLYRALFHRSRFFLYGLIIPGFIRDTIIKISYKYVVKKTGWN